MSRKMIHKVSRLFQPMNVIQKNLTSTNVTHKGYNLMVDGGIIKQINPGMYALLPLGLTALQKLVNLVEDEMSAIGAQKIQLPMLASTTLWKKTERLEMAGHELFQLRDRHNKSYVLSPTYEEMITKLIADVGVTKSDLPLFLYQISNKWRDELKPRLGLLRGREFVMKDLYSFDVDNKSAEHSYNLVCDAYDKIFQQLGVNYVKALGDTGIMGGTVSHEYHFFSEIGEDKVNLCSTCNYAVNKTISDSECPQCKKPLTENDAVEVGHTFLLNTKYSEIFKATLKTPDGNMPLAMGCYGLGLSRILAASVAVLSSQTSLRWPQIIAPYKVCIIGPKKGSKEEPASNYVTDIYEVLTRTKTDTIIDDRSELTIGRRLVDAKKSGYPFVVIVGKRSIETQPLFEVNDMYNSTSENMSIDSLIDYFQKKYSDGDLRKTAVC